MPAFRPPHPRRVLAILRRLRAWHGDQLQTALGQLRQREMGVGLDDPFQILIGTILSQRTRDEVTYAATRRLLARYPDPAGLAAAPVDEVRTLIRGVGFPNQKAPRIQEVARILAAEHGGKVPATLEGLVALPGVGRKTANCVLVYGHGVPAIPVDTHVHRISNRLGLVRTADPEATEAALQKVLPRSAWMMINEDLVSLGKAVCRPIGPRCWECPLAALCPSRRDARAARRPRAKAQGGPGSPPTVEPRLRRSGRKP